MTELLAGDSRLLSPAECADLLSWAIGRPEPAWAGRPLWLLAHTDGGVVWGHRRTPGGDWALSSQAFPDVSPRLEETTLWELRLFGREEELLVWRDDEGLAGRRLADATAGASESWGEPIDEERVLLGDRVHPRYPQAANGFTVVAEAGGARHAVPLDCSNVVFRRRPWPLRLLVRHYLTRAPSGAVRVAATRLIDVSVKEEGR